jgi:hypothetical protein
MKTLPTSSRLIVIAACLAALIVAGCGTAAVPPVSAVPSPPPTVGSPGGAGGGSSGSDGGSGIGVGNPVAPGPVDPLPGRPALVIPKPGQRDPHPVNLEKLEASLNGRHVLVKVTWTSGVEPCNVLDSVQVQRDGKTFGITVLEGSGDANAICIEIAQQKATIVDLGELEPGEITIVAANGNATPVTVQIS